MSFMVVDFLGIRNDAKSAESLGGSTTGSGHAFSGYSFCAMLGSGANASADGKRRMFSTLSLSSMLCSHKSVRQCIILVVFQAVIFYCGFY
jgi:hypothetical protein